jgi:hypothetical protein
MEGRLMLLITLAASGALAGCTSASRPPRPVVSSPVSAQTLPSPIAAGYGVVTGGMYRCSALAPVVAGPPTTVDGTVSVFPGPNDGLPREIITTEGTYAIELPPGQYDLVGHWTGSNLAPPMARVIVSSGTTTHQDLVYTGCK